MRRRKRILVRLDLQLRVVLVSFLVTCIVLLVHFRLTMSGLWALAAKAPATVESRDFVESMQSVLGWRFVLAAIVAVPLSAALGIAYSFRFAGPIYRFRRYFSEMITGRWDQHLMLRRTDDLRDVSRSINEALDQMRARLKSHQEIFADLELFFRHAGFAVDGASQARLTQLRVRLASEIAAHEARFPISVTGSAPGAPAAKPGRLALEPAPSVEA